MTNIHSCLNRESNTFRTINKIIIFILAILILTLVIIASDYKNDAILGAILGGGSFFIWLFRFNISDIRFISKPYGLLLIILLLAGFISFVCSTSLKYKVSETFETIKSELLVSPTSDIEETPNSIPIT